MGIYMSFNKLIDLYSLQQFQTMSIPGYVDVRSPPYSAAGDGVTDDTNAIQQALSDVGNSGGGVVFLPTGNYMIATHLFVPANTSLVGVFRAPTAFSQNKGTTLLAVEGAGDETGTAFITLGPNKQESNAVLDGVTIFYPNQVMSNPPIKYPWTVRSGGGDNVTIQNVLLVNPFQAIDLFTNPSGRHLVRGVYGQPLRTGIQVDNCWDIGRIMDVHFWNFWSNPAPPASDGSNPGRIVEACTFENAFSFVFYRTGWEVVQDIFSWGYHVGMMLGTVQGAGMSGLMTNVSFDNVDVGLDVLGTDINAHVQISNLYLASDPQPDPKVEQRSTHIGILAYPGDSDAMLNVSNVTFWGYWQQAVKWDNSGVFSISNGRFTTTTPPPHLNPKIEILHGRAMIHDNYFADDNGVAIHVGTDAGDVMISNNLLEGNQINNEGHSTVESNNVNQGD